jgi:hypothetical protein
MRTPFWILLFVLGLFSGFVAAQEALQFGVQFGLGRSFTSVDNSQRTVANIDGAGGLSTPIGLELGWLPKPRLCVATGLMYTGQEMRVSRNTISSLSPLVTNYQFVSIPLDINYRFFKDKQGNKSLWIKGGLSYDWISQGSNGDMRGTRSNSILQETHRMDTEAIAAANVSLRLGVGQSWAIDRRNRFILQINLLYSQGLFPIAEGTYLYWDQSLPDRGWLGRPTEEVLGEPLERYDSIFSRGSSLTLEVKLLFSLKRE